MKKSEQIKALKKEIKALESTVVSLLNSKREAEQSVKAVLGSYAELCVSHERLWQNYQALDEIRNKLSAEGCDCDSSS